MTHLLDTDEIPRLIREACDDLERLGSGMVVNLLVDEARDIADEIQQLDGQATIDTERLERAHAALLLARCVARVRTDERPDYGEAADVIGSAIWGTAPKGATTDVAPA